MKPRDLTSLTKILGSIHQPLPLNQKESQRLLDTITTSFRKQLDAEHPGFTPESEDATKPSDAAAATSRALPSATTLGRTRPTDHHLQSILSNPLFSHEPSPAAVATGRDPMEVFDEAVARGMMTYTRASGCLMAKRREIVQSGSLSVRHAMAEAGASNRVLRWLQASGQYHNLLFLNQLRFTHELVPFLMAEDREEVVWSWLAALAKTEDDKNGNFRRKQAKGILTQMLEFKCANSRSMNTAYRCLLRAQRTLPKSWLISPTCPKEGPERERELLLYSWHRLNWNSTVLAWQHPSKTSAVLFDQFSEIGDRYINPASTANKLELAHLALHHPTKPSHEMALDVLHAPAIWEEWSKRQSDRPHHVIASTVRLRSLGMDMAQYFVQQHEADQAQSLLRVLEEKLGKYFNLNSPAPEVSAVV
ncbi:hypothetical protein MAPG_06328 [Magnaporthiopsis poae ATCC 64411]|uniref:Uncharacterized protein n=1 Tax=Magnaporthiopsis poae (strain ATCC 64411 / 73-15) TaxID=644358 RepID=A0A0C4E1Q8_MAGP6|nr:hypothetical protein MAPG_06328 [Magnaporthiopsis poae ATCC 64411]